MASPYKLDAPYAGLLPTNTWRLATAGVLVVGLAVALHTTDRTLDPRASREALSVNEDSSAIVCAPTDGAGVATFSVDVLANAADHPVTMTAVTATGETLQVEDWFLAPYDAEVPGADSGPLTPWLTEAGDGLLEPGERTQLVVSVKAGRPEVPTDVTPLTASFVTGTGDSGFAPLSVRVATAPAEPSGCLDVEYDEDGHVL